MHIVMIFFTVIFTSITLNYTYSDANVDDLPWVLEWPYDIEPGVTTTNEVFEILLTGNFIDQTNEIIIRNLAEHAIIEIEWTSGNNSHPNNIIIVEDVVHSVRLVPNNLIIFDDFIKEYNSPGGFRPDYTYRGSVSDNELVPSALLLYYPSLGLRARFEFDTSSESFTITPELKLEYIHLYTKADGLTDFLPNTLLFPTDDQIQSLVSSTITEDLVYNIQFFDLAHFVETGDLYMFPTSNE